MLRIILLALLVIAGIALTIVLARKPRNDRDWEAGLARPPLFELRSDGIWEIKDLRENEYQAGGVTYTGWRDQTINVDDLTDVWFFVEPFEAWDGVGHTLLSFSFGGETNRTLSVSVEARKEKGEAYDPIKGVFNKYELIYLWSSEKDVLTRIGASLHHDIYAYRLAVTDEQAKAILTHFIARSNHLRNNPRFYNTFTSNCTNELAKAVNEAFPKSIPWHRTYIFTGRSARHLYNLGFIAPQDMAFKQIRLRANIADEIRNAASLSENEFSENWRQHYDLAEHVNTFLTRSSPE